MKLPIIAIENIAIIAVARSPSGVPSSKNPQNRAARNKIKHSFIMATRFWTKYWKGLTMR
jgi:hypothetical protein